MCSSQEPAPMPDDRLHRILTVMAESGDSWSSARMCAASLVFTGVTGAAVMLISGDLPRGSLCATDQVSRLIEDLQYTLGEGPCVDAYQQGQVVAEPDLAGSVARRWPAFTPPAIRAGARAV